MKSENKSKDEIINLIYSKELYILLTDKNICDNIIRILWPHDPYRTNKKNKNLILIYQDPVNNGWTWRPRTDVDYNFIHDTELYDILITNSIDQVQTLEF